MDALSLVVEWPEHNWVAVDRQRKKPLHRWGRDAAAPDTVRRLVAGGAALAFVPSDSGLLLVDSDWRKKNPGGDDRADPVLMAAYDVFDEPLFEVPTPGGGWHGIYRCEARYPSPQLRIRGEHVGDAISARHLATVHDPAALYLALRHREDVHCIRHRVGSFLGRFDARASGSRPVRPGTETETPRPGIPAGQWLSRLAHLKPDSDGWRGPCPVCGGGPRSRRFRLSRAGLVHCFSCGGRPGWYRDLLDVVGMRSEAA